MEKKSAGRTDAASQTDPAAIDRNTPLRLADAAAPLGLTAASLRTEARRGRLVIWRVAGKDWTSKAEIERMFDRCRVGPKEPDYGLDPQGQGAPPHGSSRTDYISEALAAARLKLAKPSGNLPPTAADDAFRARLRNRKGSSGAS